MALVSLQQTLWGIEAALTAPHVVMRARVTQDGGKYLCVYGENIQDGIVGEGDTPAAACADFDRAWKEGATRG